MRSLIIFWGLPLGFFWSWYYLSFHDISFGTVFFSRQMHDIMFTIYGNVLHVDPATVPGIIAKACLVDTLLLLAILAFRRRKAIFAWWEARRAASAETAEPVAFQDESAAEARSA